MVVGKAFNRPHSRRVGLPERSPPAWAKLSTFLKKIVFFIIRGKTIGQSQPAFAGFVFVAPPFEGEGGS